MQKQVINHVSTFLSPYLCGYRNWFSIQYSPLSLLEKSKKTIDNKGFAWGVFMDLSMAFDALNHELLIAKLCAYGFGKESNAIIKLFIKSLTKN